MQTAIELAGGLPLSLQAMIDNSVEGRDKLGYKDGFYLATHIHDAEFFAFRASYQDPTGRPGIVQFTMTSRAVKELLAAGATIKQIPMSRSSPRFRGQELRIPPSAFSTFDRLRAEGEITATIIDPASLPPD